MGVSPVVRRLLSRVELAAGRFYRGLMIDLGELAATVASLGPADRILEIGCGKGALATHLARTFPHADYLGVDPRQDVGRNFRGDRERVSFRCGRSTDLLIPDRVSRDGQPGSPLVFDLVLVVDVLHHVPAADRLPLLADAAALTRPGGLVVVADWERGRGPADLFCYLTCRWLAGYEKVVGARVPPHRNNLLLALRGPAAAEHIGVGREAIDVPGVDH